MSVPFISIAKGGTMGNGPATAFIKIIIKISQINGPNVNPILYLTMKTMHR